MLKATTILIVIAIALILPVVAQVEIECEDDLVIVNGIDVQFPNMDPEAVHTISLLGIEDYDPVVAVFNQQQNGSCNDDNPAASTYSAEFPSTGVVTAGDLNSQYEFTGSTFMRIVAGEFDALDGEALLIVEGNTYDGTPDQVQVRVTADMVRSRIPLTAYVIEVEPTLDLALALTDDNGAPLQDDAEQDIVCDDAGDAENCWGANDLLITSYANISNTQTVNGTRISAMLTVPLNEESINTIVPFTIMESPETEQPSTGAYVFALHYGSGEIEFADGSASVTTSPLGTALSCDDEVLVSDAVEITIPRVDDVYRISAIAHDDTDPALAIFNPDGTGECFNYADNGDELFAQLPIIGEFNRSMSNASTAILGNSARILTGSIADAPGNYLIVVDGLTIAPENLTDVISVTITDAMFESGQPLTAIMIAKDLNLNPQLALVSADEAILQDSDAQPIVCTRTDQPTTCWGEYEALNSAVVSVGGDNLTRGIGSDVMLRIPLTPELVGTTLNLQGSSVNSTSGEYMMLIHLSVGVEEEETE